MRKVIKEIRLKKDTPDHRAGERFVLMSNNGIYEIDAGEDDHSVFHGGDIKNFDEWFEEVKESGWWKPQDNEKYFFVNSWGAVLTIDTWDHSTLNCGRLSIGNCFKTQEAAERYRDYLKAIATVRQDEGVIDLQGICEEYETESNKYNDFSVYTVAFDLYLRRLVVTDADEYISANAIWFEDEEYAQSSLDNHPDEWKTIVNYDWGRETEYVYKERYAELSNNGKEDK